MTYRHQSYDYGKKPKQPPSNTFWCRGCNKGRLIRGRKLTAVGWLCIDCKGSVA